MKTRSHGIDCPYETDVVAAVVTGRWPHRADAELRAHVPGCPSCQDAAIVADAFASHEDAARPLPDASLVWLRAQLRARADATRVAERPITIAQAVAFAAIVGVLGALIGASSPTLQEALHWVTGALAHLDPRGVPLPPALGPLLAEHMGFVAAIGLSVMLMPVGVYWIIRDRGEEV